VSRSPWGKHELDTLVSLAVLKPRLVLSGTVAIHMIIQHCFHGWLCFILRDMFVHCSECCRDCCLYGWFIARHDFIHTRCVSSSRRLHDSGESLFHETAQSFVEPLEALVEWLEYSCAFRQVSAWIACEKGPPCCCHWRPRLSMRFLHLSYHPLHIAAADDSTVVNSMYWTGGDMSWKFSSIVATRISGDLYCHCVTANLQILNRSFLCGNEKL